nr:cell division control protein 45 homolog [Cherax quadricarinatus]
MFITDLRKQFYNLITGKRILLLVHFDVDGICASKILQSLFRTDHILYTVVPIQTRTDLINAFQQHAEQVKHIVLINCGGCIDLVDLLQPSDDLVFFVADNHRPLDICNIYNAEQIRIMTKLGDEEEVPAFDDVFREDESEEESDEEGGKRPRFDEEALEKRRERRHWEQQRHKIIFDYTQFSYYGSSTATLMFDLAWKLSKDSNELLWWAIVGETEQLISEQTEPDKYLLVTATLQNHVSRLNHKAQDEQPLDCLRITFEKEYPFSTVFTFYLMFRKSLTFGLLKGTPDARFFAAPHCLSLLARFTLKAHVAVSRSKKSRSLPLIITTPDVRSSESNICLVCGIPPTSEESPRNFFGKAFEQAADKTGSKAELEFFDTNIIRLSVDDRSKFFDALISLLS